MAQVPSMDAWLQEAKKSQQAEKIGMYLSHNGVVRSSARAQVRSGVQDAPAVRGMEFSADREKAAAAVADTLNLPGIYYARVWLNEGCLQVGDDLMYVLVGGDIRPNTVAALEYLIARLKGECVSEQELYD